MTPMARLMGGGSPNPEPNYSQFSNVASQARMQQEQPAQAEQPQPEAQTPPENPKQQQLETRFGELFRQIQTLAQEFPAGDEGLKFLKDANNALSNWFSSAVQKVNSAPNGGNSNY